MAIEGILHIYFFAVAARTALAAELPVPINN
jgi:hypothetical protein